MAKTAQQGAQYTGEPTARMTVQSELEALFNVLVETGGELDALEQTFEPVLHSGGVGEEGAGHASPPQPDVINKIRDLISSVRAHNARLSNIRLRAAL